MTELDKGKVLIALKKAENTEDVTVVDLKTEAVLSEGKNFMGNLFRHKVDAKVNGEDKKFAWISKVPPSDPERMKMHRSVLVEKKEIAFYSEVYIWYE